MAIKDRHASRTKIYRTQTEKRCGGGKGNWGSLLDYYDEAEAPLNEPFEDCECQMPQPLPEYTKLRVR